MKISKKPGIWLLSKFNVVFRKKVSGRKNTNEFATSRQHSQQPYDNVQVICFFVCFSCFALYRCVLLMPARSNRLGQQGLQQENLCYWLHNLDAFSSNIKMSTVFFFGPKQYFPLACNAYNSEIMYPCF